jgi:hypothetical protein
VDILSVNHVSVKYPRDLEKELKSHALEDVKIFM